MRYTMLCIHTAYTALKYLAFTCVIIIIIIIVLVVVVIIIIIIIIIIIKTVLFCLDTFRHCKFGWFAADRELVPAF